MRARLRQVHDVFKVVPVLIRELDFVLGEEASNLIGGRIAGQEAGKARRIVEQVVELAAVIGLAQRRYPIVQATERALQARLLAERGVDHGLLGRAVLGLRLDRRLPMFEPALQLWMLGERAV